MRVRAARGAITVDRDEPGRIVAAAARVLRALLADNEVYPEDVVSVVFTSTPDLRSVFPAEAAREVGLGHVPLLCAQELDVEGAMPRVVRVLLHFHTERPQSDVRSAYLEGARALRPDRA